MREMEEEGINEGSGELGKCCHTQPEYTDGEIC